MDPLDDLHDRLGTFLGALGLETAHRPGGVTAVQVDDVPVLLSGFVEDGATWLRLVALARVEVTPSVALLHHLTSLNRDLLVGAFQLFEDGTIGVSATLPGGMLDAHTLERVLRYVGGVAARERPAFIALGGGAPWRPDAPASPGEDTPPC
ncbi:MAG: YbjN domain-containing protein [Alphaproteobacteria bacterium]|nr:YbjN domain-containing protein [Alphaproteobacteria bacterium]